MKDLSFTKTQTTNQTDKTVEFLYNLFENIKTNGPPKLMSIDAEKFYEKYGFIKLPDSGKIFLVMQTIKELFE